MTTLSNGRRRFLTVFVWFNCLNFSVYKFRIVYNAKIDMGIDFVLIFVCYVNTFKLTICKSLSNKLSHSVYNMNAQLSFRNCTLNLGNDADYLSNVKTTSKNMHELTSFIILSFLFMASPLCDHIVLIRLACDFLHACVKD